MTDIQLSALNADILRNLGAIAEDENLLNRAAKYLRKLVKERDGDSTRMTEKEFFAKVDRGLKAYERGEYYEMLPDESLTAFLKRRGYDI